MKFPVVFLAVLGLVCGKPLPLAKFQEELKDFLVLVPTDKILEIALDYVANDTEVKELIAYVQSEEFPKIHAIVEDLKEYKDCFKFITDQGVDVYEIISEIYYILEKQPFQPTNTTRMGVGIYGLIDDVMAVLPLDDLTALLDKKLETRELFRSLLTAIRSLDIMKMVDTVRAWPEYHEMLEILQEMVPYVERIYKLLWEPSLREIHRLQDDLKKFTALFPTDKVLEIIRDYLESDPELHKVLVYIQSEEFPRIHKIVEYLKEHKDCFKFISDQGVDVYAIISEIHYILERHPYQPTNTTRTGVGIYGLIDDVIAVLPLSEWKALLDKKMEASQYLKTLVKLIDIPAFMSIVDTVRSWPEYYELLEIVREKDVDVHRIIGLFKELYKRGTPWLKDSLKELMAIIPTDKVLEIALDYLAYDQEVREFIVYIQSEEFPKIHTIVEHLKEYKDCFKYISEYGIDVYEIISEIHYILEKHPFQPTNTTRMGVGFYGLIDDVIAVLPLDELAAFLDKKLITGEFFKNLLTAIRSLDVMKMVDTVRAWPEYREMLEILREMVPYVERIYEILRELSLRGIHLLQDDLKEFMALVPTDKVLEITMDYLHEPLVYIQSEEFPKIHKIVEYLKKYKDCFPIITDQGVDIYAIVNEVRDILGLPPIPPKNITHMGVGIYGLIDDVIAVLPLDDLKVLLDMKMETRLYIKTLVTVIRSPVLVSMVETVQDLVETVQALPQYQRLLEILREEGVDVERIIEHLRVIFGLPPP